MSRIMSAALVAILVVGVAVASPPVPAQLPASVPTTATPSPQRPLADMPLATPIGLPAAPRVVNPADLAAYVDGVVAAYMRRQGIAGVTVAVVDTQGPLLLRGYGISQQASARKVDPAATLFRIGSVSKTFTYLEALKLIDAGQLSLDAPVNQYLPTELKLADDGFKPVRVRHLLTHTAGYEDTGLGHLFAASAATVPTANAYLRAHRPERVREPGTHAVYSNYAVALLGALVANVAGVPFEALAERDFFNPMGMGLSTFREPLPAGDPRKAGAQFAGRWSEGFKREAGGVARQDFEYIAHIAPAGGVSTTAADMARYLTMLVNRGTLDGVPVVAPSAFAQLEGEPLFRNAAEATGFSYGFFRRRYGNVQSLEHGGATLFFHSNMVAVPELGFGVFVSANTDSGANLAAELPGLLIERYFPTARATALPTPSKALVEKAKLYAGTYLSERRNYTTFEKVLLSTAATVGVTEDGYLTLTGGNETTRWLYERPHVFRAVRGTGALVFLTDAQGGIVGFVAPGGHHVFDRVGFFDNPQVLYALVALALLASVGVLTGAWLRHRRPARVRSDVRPGARIRARWLYFAASAWIACAVIVAVALQRLSSNPILSCYPGSLLRVGLWLAVAAMASTAVAIVRLPSVWGARHWSVWRKLRHTTVVAVFALAAWALWVWNVVGWKV